MQARAIVLLVFVGLGAGGGSETARHAEAIVYTIGLSTDPYGNPSPDGFGVVTAPLRRPLAKVEVRDRRYGWSEGAAWLDRTRILVPRRDLRRLFFRYRTGHLEPGGSAPLPAPVWTFAWSRDRRLLAVEPAARCDRKQPLRRCFKASHRIFVSRADGSRRRLAVRGELGGWTPKAELIYSPSAVETRYLALDLVTRHRTTLPRSLAGAPIWSGDGRYFTGTISMPRRRPRVSGAFSIWQSDGELLQTVTSRYAISMVAWSPRGRRLAYTTSGFPTPHELFVVDRPGARPRRIFRADEHFDWVTWSPDARQLLLDYETRHQWRLLDASGRGSARILPRLGGRPLWCCPQQEYFSNH